MDKLRIDGEKMSLHPHRVVQLLDGRDDWEKSKEIFPLYIEVSPCGACSHRCKMCSVDYLGYKTNMIDADIFGQRIAEMGALGVKSIMLAGEGEPLLNRHINEMVGDAANAGIDTAFTTNGVLLDQLELDHVQWVKVSVNGGTPSTYAEVHQTKIKDWDRVWSNIRDAVKRKGTCTIGVQMVLLPENEHEVDDIRRMGEEAGVDYIVIKPHSQHKFSIVRQYENYKASAPKATEKMIVRNAAFETKEVPYDKCLATPFTWAYWMSSGYLYSCSAYLLDDHFNLGNLNEQSFKDVWQGERRRKNWEHVRHTLSISECRVNCRQDKVNKYLTDVVHGVPHQHFI